MRLFPNENTGKGWDQSVISSLSLCFFCLCVIGHVTLPVFTAILTVLLFYFLKFIILTAGNAEKL